MLRGQPPVSMAEISSKVYQARIGRVSPLYVGLHIAQKFAQGATSNLNGPRVVQAMSFLAELGVSMEFSWAGNRAQPKVARVTYPPNI